MESSKFLDYVPSKNDIYWASKFLLSFPYFIREVPVFSHKSNERTDKMTE
jgi:hypothetical protein